MYSSAEYPQSLLILSLHSPLPTIVALSLQFSISRIKQYPQHVAYSETLVMPRRATPRCCCRCRCRFSTHPIRLVPWLWLLFILIHAYLFDLAASFSAMRQPPRDLSRKFTAKIKNSRHWKDGVEVLRGMENEGYAPDAYQYSAVISKCAKARKWQKALMLLKRMLNQGWRRMYMFLML